MIEKNNKLDKLIWQAYFECENENEFEYKKQCKCQLIDNVFRNTDIPIEILSY